MSSMGRLRTPVLAAPALDVNYDVDWIAALQRHTGDEPRWDGERLVGGARQLASMPGEQAKDEPYGLQGSHFASTKTSPMPR